MRSLAILLLGLAIATPAMAQQADGNATGGAAGANSTTGTSQASNTVVVNAITGPNSTTNVPQKQDVNYSGHTYTTPAVGGSYFAGANPCLVGTGAGAAGGPIGFNINVGRSDKDCTRRSDAAAWYALGLPAVAVTRLCQDMDKRNPMNADAFFSATGFACPGTNSTGRYKLADGSLAPYPVLPNQMPVRATAPQAPTLVDPTQKVEPPVVPNPRPSTTMAPTIPSNPR